MEQLFLKMSYMFFERRKSSFQFLNICFRNIRVIVFLANWHGACFFMDTGDVAVWKHLSTFMEIEKMKKDAIEKAKREAEL